MIVNLIVIALILFIGFHYKYVHKANADSDAVRKKYIYIISFFLILQSGLRNVAVGDDTYSYFIGYQDVSNTPWNYIMDTLSDYYKYGIGKDPGFLILQKVVQYVITDFQIFLILIAICFFTVLGRFLYKNTTRLTDVILGFLIYSVLFYSFYSITGIRQTVATILTLYSFEFIKKRKIIPFVLIVLLAATMHKSSIIFIVFYFVSRIKSVKYFYSIALLLFPVFFIFKDSVSGYLRILSGYEVYEQTENAGSLNFTILFLLISIVALLRKKIILENNPNAIYYYNAFGVAVIFLPLAWVNPNAIRIIMYFSIFMILFIPEILHSFGSISKKIKGDVVRFAMITLIALYIKTSWDEDKRMPYGFFWEEMRLTDQYYDRGLGL